MNLNFKKFIMTLFLSPLFLVIFFIVACATSPTGRKQFILVGDEEMNLMGDKAFTEMKKTLPIDKNFNHLKYVQCVVKALAPHVEGDLRGTDWEVVVFSHTDPNAFALPGGKIGVHTGMFSVAKTQDQLAAVLGHEIGHVIARHGAERVSTSMAAESGLMVADVLMGDKKSRTNVMAALGLGTQFGVLLPHGRKQESEADRIGLELMSQAGFNPQESVRLWENMSAVGGGKTPEFLSTHPSNSRRIEDLQKDMGPSIELYRRAQSQGLSPQCYFK